MTHVYGAAVLMLKMMETKLTARLTDSNDAIKRREGGAEGGGGGTLQQVLETQERLEGMQTKLELDVQAMDKRVAHQLQHQSQLLQAAQEAASHRHQGSNVLAGRVVRLPPPLRAPFADEVGGGGGGGEMLQQVLETQERLQGKLERLQAAQEAASQRHQVSLDKVHELLGALVAGVDLGGQRTLLPGEADA